MTTPNGPTAEDVMRDIEIELLQGAVTHDELGQSVENVRRFQNQLRGEALDAQPRPDYRAIANRQFQINDMLLTLLQEMATRQRALELEVRKGEQQGLWPLPEPGDAGLADAGSDAGTFGATDALVRRLGEIENAMRDDALTLQLEVTPQETPVIGRALGGMRAALHSLVVFYTNRLAAKQTEINRLYGDSLHQLLQDNARLADALNALHAENGELRARLDALEARER